MKKSGFNIHKSVKKKEMLFEYILIVVLCILFVYLILYAFGLLPAFIKKFNIIEVAGIFVTGYTLVWHLHSAIVAKRVVVTLGLNASVTQNDVLVSASVTNSGTKSIYPLLTNLYISEGIMESIGDVRKIKFEPVTEHNFSNLSGGSACFDCQLAQQCKNDAKIALEKNRDITNPNFPQMDDNVSKQFANTIRFAHNLRLLSYHSLVHIMPNESFSEQVVFLLPKAGYYRLFLIYTDKEWKDCICKSAVVRISEGEK